MDVNKFNLTITKSSDSAIPTILIELDDEIIGMVQEADISLRSEPTPSYVITIKRWKVIGNPDVETLNSMKEGLNSTLGVYVKPFTNNLEYVTDEIVVVPED